MFLEKNGVNLFYSSKGTGDPALVFVHGWLASHEVWHEQVAEFSQTHAVVSIDLRGFGESDKPEGEYSFDVFAADLDFMIQALGLARPILIGWSMGAAIGLIYATAHPDKISKLVLVGGTPLLIATDDYPHAIPGEAADHLLGAMNADFSTGARGFVELEFPEPGTEALKDMAHAITQQTTLEVALNSIGPAAGRDLRPLLSQVKMPTLILSGDQDQICLPAASQYMHEHIPNSELHRFPGKGHLPFLTATQAFNERLRGFIAG